MRLLRRLVDLLASSIVFVVSRWDGGRDRLVLLLTKLREALKAETIETKEMLAIYNRFTQGKASKEELQKAHDQLKDVLKTVGLGVILMLPFAPITLPLLVKLSELVGFNLFPSSLRGPPKKKSTTESSH